MMIPRIAVFAEASLLLASAQQFMDRFNYDVMTPNSAARFTDYVLRIGVVRTLSVMSLIS
jgi:hypothetical protein